MGTRWEDGGGGGEFKLLGVVEYEKPADVASLSINQQLFPCSHVDKGLRVKSKSFKR